VGVRSINNVVDATNYVMFELGQPMHAYDLATLHGPELVARRAASGEKLVTLDGVERTLDDEMTVIADADRVVGVAGVMGGRDTEVSERTTDLVLECAWFTPSRIRRTRRALGLSSEASHRFERGVDRWNGAEAMRRCIELIIVTAGGRVADAPLDVHPDVAHPPRIFLRLARVAQVLGLPLAQHDVERALVAIGATVVAKPDDGRLAVDVPGMAARPHGRDRPGGGSSPRARLREAARRAGPVPGRRAAGCAGGAGAAAAEHGPRRRRPVRGGEPPVRAGVERKERGSPQPLGRHGRVPP
jgi:phenylalanyl-tRNA synthetase beta chain